jgi:hypothetical protein
MRMAMAFFVHGDFNYEFPKARDANDAEGLPKQI